MRGATHDLLVLAPDPAFHAEVTAALAGEPLDIVFASSVEALDRRYAADGARVILIPESLPQEGDWERVVALVRAHGSAVPAPVLVALNAHDADRMLEWLRRGAFACAVRPLDPVRFAELVRTVRQAARTETSAFHALEINHPLPGWVELTAPSRGEFLVRFDAFLQQLTAAGLDDLTRRQVMQAVTELGQNAIEWGNTYDDGKQFRISYCLFDDRVIFKIEDEGAGFDPAAVRDPTADPIGVMSERQQAGKRPGGYGLAMVRRVMDEVMFNDRGNVVICEKRFRGPKS